MKITITKLFLAVALLLSFASWAQAQATLTSTTLSAAVTSESATTIRVASATGFTANTTQAFVENESLDVTGVNGTTISVRRGANGTRASKHPSGATVWVGPGNYFTSYPRSGACTSGDELVLPRIDVTTGNVYRCTSSEWDREETITTIKPSLSNHLILNTRSDGKQVRINSRDFTQTSGSSIGFQSKPAQTVASSGNVIGGEISPRVNSGIALTGGGSVIGLHVDAYLKGTAAGTIAGDVRGLQVELVTDDSGTRTISGDVAHIRLRSAFSATGITGDFVAFKVEKPEAQTNSQTYDALFKLTGTIPLVWNSAPATEPSTADGYIKVLVNGVARYIQLYSTAPVD